MIAVASGAVKDTGAPVRLLHTLSINMFCVIPTELLFLLGEGIFFGFWSCQVMEMEGAIWNNAARGRATHNGCEVAACFLTLANHNGRIVETRPWQPSAKSTDCRFMATTCLILISLPRSTQNMLWKLKIYKQPSLVFLTNPTVNSSCFILLPFLSR